MPEPGRAARLDRAISAAPSGPLRGVVVGVKDIFHVDGLPTTAGSSLPVGELAGPEAAAVSLLRDAGAVVLGKTVSSEFALFEPGPTRNPRNLAHTPGGSSSGSAAAVVAGHGPLALGSQTIGSVIRPAAFWGVVGYKPSYGRISTAGVVPLAESFDTVGLLASKVSWVERAAAVLCAWWRPGAVKRTPALGIPDGPYLEQASELASAVLAGLGATRVPRDQGGEEPERAAGDCSSHARLVRVFRTVRPGRHAGARVGRLALVLPNWVPGPFYFILFALLVALRIGPEERMMLEEFGKDYELYMTRTKRLVPGVF